MSAVIGRFEHISPAQYRADSEGFPAVMPLADIPLPCRATTGSAGYDIICPVETVIPEEKTIYLTFDDGPSAYTGQLLDVLARSGVKATFFVTNLNPEYQDLIGRAFREGHAIGVHTSSHNYAQIYQSKEAFYRDFLGMQEIIYEQTGSYTRLFRFPGGSSNTVSRNYCYGIMTQLAKSMTGTWTAATHWVEPNPAMRS